MNPTGRTPIVTGRASGIGRASARLLARAGARIVIGDLEEEGGRSRSCLGRPLS